MLRLVVPKHEAEAMGRHEAVAMGRHEAVAMGRQTDLVLDASLPKHKKSKQIEPNQSPPFHIVIRAYISCICVKMSSFLHVCACTMPLTFFDHVAI